MIGRAFLAVVSLCLGLQSASAGTQCVDKAPSAEAIATAAQVAIATYRALDENEAEMAILARVGADISEHGLRYTHGAFVMRDHPKGRWFLRHQLNICATDKSRIFDQGLMNFLLDDPLVPEILVIIPKTEMQRRLVAAVLSKSALALHHDDYSMIANPFSTRYQNSNQWVLEMIAVAQAPHGGNGNRRLAQDRLRRADFRPSRICISPFKLLGASLFRANVRFDDHTQAEADSGVYNVVSVRSVRDYLNARGEIANEFVVRP